MRTFTLTANLLKGITWRLLKLPSQDVISVLQEQSPAKALRRNQALCRDIDAANSEFVSAVAATEKLNNEAFVELKKEYDSKTNEQTDPKEAAAIGKELRVRYAEICSKNNAASEAKPDVAVTVELGNDKFDDLVKLIDKTVGSWDVLGQDGEVLISDQSRFLEIADALDAATSNTGIGAAGASS